MSIVKLIRKKFEKIPNTGHMQIWLQRVTFPLDRRMEYDECICKLVVDISEQLWNSDWISLPELKATVDASKIVDSNIRDVISLVIPLTEIDLFLSKAMRGYNG